MTLLQIFEQKLQQKQEALRKLRKQASQETFRDLTAEILRMEGSVHALKWVVDKAHEDAQAGFFKDGGVK